MTKTLLDVSKAAEVLTTDEKLALARMMSDLADDAPMPAPAVELAWEQEIQRRIADLRAGKIRSIPAEEVRRKIEAELFK